MCHGFYPQQRVSGFAVPAACRRRRDWLPMGRPGIAAVWRRRCRCSPAGYAVPTARGKRGQGHRMVPLPPLAPAAGRRQCTRHVMANIPRPGRASLASSGKPLYRRNRLPSAEGKERRTLVASDGENQAFFACLRSTADFTISMPIRHTTPIRTMVPPGFSPP